jgi:L-ascorbate metabolism protein UlaG (beta-lactamase superfamily)
MTPPSITFVGHSTVEISLSGATLITDPVLGKRVGHLRRISAPVPHPGTAPDAVLISHVHYDHLDKPSLRRIGAQVPVVAPVGAGRLLRRIGTRSVVELEPGEATEVAGVTVVATAADHDTTRLPGGRRVPAAGYVVGSGPRVYFAGDTDVFDGMEAIGDLGLDVALLPVTGWGPRVPAGHMDPRRAAAALRLLRPRIAVPIHWGTLALIWARSSIAASQRAEADLFAREAAAVAPEVEVRILEPGESLAVPAAAAR